MIQMQTLLDIADNTGAKSARTIKVLGGTRRRTASVGDIVVASIQKSLPGSTVKSGQVVKVVVIRTKTKAKRSDGGYVSFDSNAAVLIDADNNPRGTRIFGAVARELRDKKFMKIVSLAAEVV